MKSSVPGGYGRSPLACCSKARVTWAGGRGETVRSGTSLGMSMTMKARSSSRKGRTSGSNLVDTRCSLLAESSVDQAETVEGEIRVVVREERGLPHEQGR